MFAFSILFSNNKFLLSFVAYFNFCIVAFGTATTTANTGFGAAPAFGQTSAFGSTGKHLFTFSQNEYATILYVLHVLIGFGTSAVPSAPAFGGFGTTATAATTAPPGFSFANSATAGQPAGLGTFGQPAAPTAGFGSFGSTSMAPATSGQ